MIELLQQSPITFTLFAGLAGLLVGSFLNVVIYRVPKMMELDWRAQCAELMTDDTASASETAEKASQEEKPAPKFNLIVPRSACPNCQHQITALENIPVLSYLFLKGKCSSCRTPISMRYPIVEFFTGVMTAAVAWRFGFGAEAVMAILLTWALIALSGIDLDTFLLPDSITQPVLWLGLAMSLFSASVSADVLFIPPDQAIIGAMVGYLSLWSVYWLFKLATGKEGMGYGDFKLLALLGAWLGWTYVPMIVLLSALVGATVGIALILFKKHGRNVPIPFGPYLAAAGWVALIWGEPLMLFYRRISNLD